MNKVICILVGILICAGAAFADGDENPVSNLQVMTLSRSRNLTTYSIKADVDNAGDSGSFYIHVVAKNRDGFQVSEKSLVGDFAAGEKRVLTTTDIVRNEIADTIDRWIIDTVKKH